MHRKLTITLDGKVYESLYKVIGRRQISQFIEDLVRSRLMGIELEEGYRQMAQDEAREVEALDWAEGTLGDVADRRHG